MKEYQIVGKSSDPAETSLYKITIFANNEVVAKSRFFKYMSKINKIKKNSAEIVSIVQKNEKNLLKARSYGIWIQMKIKRSLKNLYKEYRETSRVNAVKKCFNSLYSLYKVKYFDIDIVSIVELKDDEIKKEEVKQFTKASIRFPNLFCSKKKTNHVLEKTLNCSNI